MREIKKIVDMGDRLNLQGNELSLQEQLDNENLEKVKLEKELIEAKEKLNRLNKLFSVITHDLRSPFQGLVGFLNVIVEETENDTSLDEDLKEQLKLVNNSAEVLLNLTVNILTWAKNTSEETKVELSEVKLESEIKDIFDALKINALSKKIELIDETDPGLTVLSNKEAINIIIRNLISNAIKFTQQGGRIKVSSIKIDGRIQIVVEDNGIGIDSERIDRIFNMQETTKGTNREQGNGLGLYLCKEIIEKLGGDIKVESKIEKGTKFIVSLPVIEK